MKKTTKNHQQEKGKELDMEKLQEQLQIPFSKSKADVWEEIEAQLDATPVEREIRIMASPIFRFAIAASIIFLLGIVGVMRFYSITENTLPGQHLVVNLPDGSIVQMNAASSLSYHPYWWQFSRSLSFNGEGYFKVEKGSRFQVKSDRGSTTVLGTSFNIYSRDTEYRVACLTGKVRVADRENREKVIITPNQMAELTANGIFSIQKNIDAASKTAWVHNKFIFTATPLNHVFEEIERQYNVKILGKEAFKNNYTGNFDRDQNIDEVLNFVCKAMDVKFDKVNANEYQLTN